MSDPVTALDGAQSTSGIVEITEVALQGMITLRGDLSDKKIQSAAIKGRSKVMPGPGQAMIQDESGIAWMSPDEALILCAYDQVAAEVRALKKALGTAHALVVNVSDARASFRIKGVHARDVLAKLCPVDLSPDVFGPGKFRRTRMAQVPAALWQADDDSFQVICFRSQAQYVFDLLSVSAQAGSYVR
ncbi:MAG: sarcosine oxidase subunit gamma family protein [Pseudomonadota bacterium]